MSKAKEYARAMKPAREPKRLMFGAPTRVGYAPPVFAVNHNGDLDIRTEHDTEALHAADVPNLIAWLQDVFLD